MKGITGMDTKAHKCPSCKNTYKATKISQIYCSAKCRQAAYRKRKRQQTKTRRSREEKPLYVPTCEHCGGTFWAKRQKARFCSTSCRTMYHRALRVAIPDALRAAFGLSPVQAADLVETQPIGRIRSILVNSGFVYEHRQRMWVQLCSDLS